MESLQDNLETLEVALVPRVPIRLTRPCLGLRRNHLEKHLARNLRIDLSHAFDTPRLEAISPKAALKRGRQRSCIRIGVITRSSVDIGRISRGRGKIPGCHQDSSNLVNVGDMLPLHEFQE